MPPSAYSLSNSIGIHCFITPSNARLVLRVQFLELKVNLNRWAEEIELVNAEITFTIGSFEYKAQYWMVHQEDVPGGLATSST